jgi:hypothetical protein
MESTSPNNRTISNNKPDIIMCYNETITCMLLDVAVSEDRNVIKKETEKILKYKELIIEIHCMWNVKEKVIPVITGGNWDHCRLIQTVPEQHMEKACNQGTTKNSHIGHCTHTSESTNVKVRNTFHMQINITCSTNCKYRRTTTLYTLET